MGWKCIVEGCTTKSTLPSHMMPTNQQKAKEWLEMINRSDLTTLSKDQMKRLRICYAHFSEDMVYTHGTRRLLKNHAFPVLRVAPSANNVEQTQEDLHNYVIEKTHPPSISNESMDQFQY